MGFLDDYIKIFKQRSLGLRSKAKLIGQTAVAIVFAVLALQFPDAEASTPASQAISFVRDIALALPTVLVVLWVLLMIAGTSNGVNLTDGLDGLAAGASSMVFGAYTLVGIWQNNQFCAITAGAAVLRRPRPARPGGGGRRADRRVFRLPVVERLPGPDLHGRHRVAVARRRDGRASRS